MACKRNFKNALNIKGKTISDVSVIEQEIGIRSIQMTFDDGTKLRIDPRDTKTLYLWPIDPSLETDDSPTEKA